jgi:hypothetical protein
LNFGVCIKIEDLKIYKIWIYGFMDLWIYGFKKKGFINYVDKKELW